MRLIRDCIMWLFCRACYAMYVHGPWRIMSGWFGFAILGYAGMYGYSTDWADFRECVQWNADGRPKQPVG